MYVYKYIELRCYQHPTSTAKYCIDTTVGAVDTADDADDADDDADDAADDAADGADDADHAADDADDADDAANDAADDADDAADDADDAAHPPLFRRQLVAFLIYLTTLSGGFNEIASVLSPMMEAVGSAHSVFELIRREPNGPAPPEPSSFSKHRVSTSEPGLPVMSPMSGSVFSTASPDACRGDVELRGVNFEYPSR